MGSTTVRAQIPGTAPFVVSRARLAGLVAPAGTNPPQLVLVTAPAGSGKTTLLAQMAARLVAQGDVVAWLSVTPNDGDDGRLPARVLASLAQSLGTRAPAVAARLTALPIPPIPLDPGFVAEAARPLREVHAPVWLLIDDHHLLGSGWPLAWLDGYLAAAGPVLHIVVAGRRDLGSELSRHLLDGSAVSITAADLALSLPETAQMLSEHGLTLPDPDVQELHRRTEGWAAGLRLAALALAGTTDAVGKLASLAGSTRQIGAYLVSEVLHALPRESQDFLRSTAAPRVLTIDLAALLSGRADAGAVLEQLLTDGLLITRHDADQPTYRYHALLRSHLLEEEAAADLVRYRWQRRLSARHAADRGDQDEALEHATAGQAWDLLVDLLGLHGLAMILRGDETRVARGLAAVPARYRTDRLVLLAAELALRRGEPVRAQEQLAQLSGRSAPPTDVETEVLRTAVLLHSSIMSGRVGPDFADLLEPPLGLLHSPETMLLSSLRAMALIEVDQGARAATELRRAQHFAATHGYDALALDCLSHLVLISWAEGSLASALALVEEASEFAADRGWQATAPMAAIFLIGAGSGFAMLEPAVVDRYLPRAAALSAAAEPKVAAFSALLPVYVRHAFHPAPAKLAAELDAVWDDVDEQVIRPVGMTSLCLIEIGLAADQGDLALAERVADRAERHLAGRGDLDVVRATLTLLHGQPAAVLRRLDELRSSARRTTTRGRVQAAILRALAADGLHRDAEAQQAVLTAVRTAAEHGLVEPLAVAPGPFSALLRRNRAQLDAEAGFVFRVLAATSERSAAQDVAPGPSTVRLTKREGLILRELGSLATLQEIADHHRVSENTVKSHVKAIYDKLGVHSRRDAVRRARHLGLDR